MIYFSGFLRTLLASLAGGLISKGYVDAQQADILVGAAGIVATAAWSAAAKSKYFPRIK